MKSQFLRLAFGAMIFAVASQFAAAAESLSTLLQRAIYAEETEGNLDSAIKLYEQIATETDANRPLAAEAKYRLAVCYQKKGNNEQAIRVLNDLVEAPADGGLKKKVRDALAGMGGSPSQQVSIRRVAFEPRTHWLMSISADARYAAYQPDDSNDIAVYDFTTRRSQTVFKGGKDNDPWNDAIISPDGEWVAYDVKGAAIYVVRRDGSETRKVFAGPAKDDYAEANGWLNGGKELVIAFWPDKRDEPATAYGVDLSSNRRREIARFARSSPPDRWHFSPDGKYVARRKGSFPRMISLVDLGTGREDVIVDRDAGNLIGWAPDQSKLIFAKSRGTTYELLALPVKDGKAGSAPEAIWANWDNFGGAGISASGSIFYRVRKPMQPTELWAMDGLLDRKPILEDPVGAARDIPADEMAVNGSTFSDRKYQFRFEVPNSWTITSAMRAGRIAFSRIVLRASESRPTMWINYHSPVPSGIPSDSDFAWLNGLSPMPNGSTEVDVWLRRFADAVIKRRVDNKGGFPGGFQPRPASFQYRIVAGHRALAYLADYASGDKPWIEYQVFIYGAAIMAGTGIQASAADFEKLRPAFEQMVESIRLP